MIRNWWSHQQALPNQKVQESMEKPIFRDPLEALKAQIGSLHNLKAQLGIDATHNAMRPLSGFLQNASNIIGGHPTQHHDYAGEAISTDFSLIKHLKEQENAEKELNYKLAHLAELSRYHTILGNQAKRQNAQEAKEERQMRAYEALQTELPGAIPFSMLGHGVAASVAELRERANKPIGEAKVLKTLDGIVAILKEYPELSTSAAGALFPEKYTGGFGQTARLALMNKEHRVALERINKLANSLVLKDVAALGKQRGNVFLETMMKASNPHHGLTYDAVKTIRDAFAEDHHEITLPDSKIARKALLHRAYIPMMEHPYKEPMPTEKNKSDENKRLNPNDSVLNTGSTPRAAIDVEALRAQHPELKAATDEQIINAKRKMEQS